MLGLLREEPNRKNRKPKHLAKYHQFWWDNQATSYLLLLLFVYFCFCHEHMLFHNRGKMHAAFKRMEEKEKKWADPDGIPF